MKDSVVKIDSKLLDSVEEFINLEKNKFRYVNKKQFVDIAVMKYLEEEGHRSVYPKKLNKGAKGG